MRKKNTSQDTLTFLPLYVINSHTFLNIILMLLKSKSCCGMGSKSCFRIESKRLWDVKYKLLEDDK